MSNTEQVNILDVPSGSYCAVTGGYHSEFTAGGKRFLARFNSGVRGFNIKDTITVTDGEVVSGLLGIAVSIAAYEA